MGCLFCLLLIFCFVTWRLVIWCLFVRSFCFLLITGLVIVRDCAVVCFFVVGLFVRLFVYDC